MFAVGYKHVNKMIFQNKYTAYPLVLVEMRLKSAQKHDRVGLYL